MVVLQSKFKPKKSLKMQCVSVKENGITAEQSESDNESNAEEQELSQDMLVVLQELNIAQQLSGNDAAKRNQQVRKLRRWLRLRAQSSFPFTDENFMRLWKGLYYSMYMADKPLPQEQLAENVARLVECFAGKIELAVRFFGAYLTTMCNEWFGIDQWRMDKFYMLMRRMLRHMLKMLKSVNWQQDAIKLFNEETKKTVLAERGCAMAMTMHYMDIIFEELAKVSKGDIDAEHVHLFVEPFLHYLVTQTDMKMLTHCRARIFNHLLHQSNLGREYQEKYEAWRSMGFPGSINDVEKVEESAEEQESEEPKDMQTESQQHLDPRAGKVDVFVPALPINEASIITHLQDVLLKNDLPAKRRKMLKNIVHNFEVHQKGEFPLGIKKMPKYKDEYNSAQELVEEKITQLETTEAEIFNVSRKLKKLNKRKRRKLLQSLNFENVKPEEMEEFIEKALLKENKQERLKRERQCLMNSWIEEELDVESDKQTMEKRLKKREKYKQFLQKMKLKRNQMKMQKVATTTPEVPVEDESQLPAPAKKLKLAESKAEESTNEKTNDWTTPLAEGEVEYFVPSRKVSVKNANLQLTRRPLHNNTVLRGKSLLSLTSPRTPLGKKRVKIALNHNSIQKPSDYIKQIKSSPNVPFDADKKPGKGLLKPNTMPSPVDPFYIKRNKLKFQNQSF